MNSLPLKGLRIIEFSGIGPGPYAGQVLADMGAEVIVIDRPKRGDIALEKAVDRRGKRSIIIDLKSPKGIQTALELIQSADALLEGNRPGVMERLGLGPDTCLALNPGLVYGRMTGWGQNGPYAQMAGHDINYLSITGALQAIGPADLPPPPPLNLMGDFGGGSMFLVTGMLAALLSAKTSGQGTVIDAAICDGVNSMMGMFHSMDAAGGWNTQRQNNWLDGAVPYYRCYQTSDQRFMAVGCIEPQFFAIMLNMLDLDAESFGSQHKIDLHHGQAAILAAKFASNTMTHWAGMFDQSDACVTPVLTYREAAQHPHMAARHALQKHDGLTHPAPAPRFGAELAEIDTNIPADGEHGDEILAELGVLAK
ncbi:MAG: CoA transferase [Rhodobacteraceae bacterium]|nr:CoA transferase [Paracoccaceae bacterium]